MGKIIHIQPIEREIYKPNLDLSLLKKRGNSKTYKGYLIQKMKEARADRNFDVCELLQHCYKKYLEFENIEKFYIESWRGKSGVKFLKLPNKVIAIRHRKKDRGEKPQEVKKELERLEINKVIMAINKLNEGTGIKTRDIAESVYGGKWKEVFANRGEHTLLTEILNYLEHCGIIHYARSGKTKVLKKIRDYQETL